MLASAPVTRDAMALNTGARSVFTTVIFTVSLTIAFPSVAVKTILYAPSWPNVGVQVKTPVLGLNEAESGSFAPEMSVALSVTES